MDYAVGNGWHPLVDEATIRLKQLGVSITSHYEKYGTLRIEVDSEPLEATIILNEMEDRSKCICEMCGVSDNDVTQVEFNGWIKTLCHTCQTQWKETHAFSTLEQYMERHQFLEADEKKVRDFLKSHQATVAYLTKTELHYTDKNGIHGVIDRSLLGIQDNLH